MNGVYPGRGAKAYAPLRGPSQCVKRSRTTCIASSQCVKRPCTNCTASSQCAKRLCTNCTASSQCAKRLCTTCAASSQCAKQPCNTCTASSQCAKRPRNTCTTPSQCAKRSRNTCTALSQCAPLPRGQSFIPARCLGGVCDTPLHGYPAKLRYPRRGRPYHGDNHSSLRDVWGAYAIRPYTGTRQTSLPPQGPPLHGYPAKLRCPRRGRPYMPPPPPPQLLGIVNA